MIILFRYFEDIDKYIIKILLDHIVLWINVVELD